ncbi:MAG: M60 family metallopeptidase [bacterium]
MGDRPLGPEGAAALGEERGCPKGSLVARSGLRFEDAITCIGAVGEFVAPRDGAVYVGMIESTDLGEGYGERLDLSGALDVTVGSDGLTAPLVRVQDLDIPALDAVESGHVELVGDHVIVAATVADVRRDAATVRQAIRTLDTIYEIEADLRGRGPFQGQRVRFVEDETIAEFAYMLAGNPIRCVPDLLHGGDNQRIFRAAEERTDIWGFAHELGHMFSFANGTWVFQYNNIEVFPNIFSINVLQTLGREAFQPNIDTYCDGRDAWMAGGDYPTFKDDPFLQLCFLMDFTAAYGWPFWQAFYAIIDETPNDRIPVGGNPEHANTWGFLRDAFSEAAGEDVTPIFNAWRVPLP